MSVLFAYPGQGAQRPGMLAALPDEPPVRACLERAADCLGQAPAELESAEALRGTRAVQLCLLIAGVAASRLLETRGHRPGLVAGLSIGAYPAAVVAGALDFDDALRLVALRGELMQAAWPEGYGMSAILGLEQAQLEALILAVRREHPPLYLANVNAERQLVVAGSEAALAALAERARAAGASAAKRLAVSVPSHCALLDEPAARLAEAFAGIRLHRPRVPYLSSSRARLVAEPAALADDLAGNMARRVEWLATLRSAYERGARLHLELPPGRVLSGLARPLFGCATPAFEGSRADTLDALLREEEKRTR
ncbi:TPA: malonate decarboxylase subunit epsilon [Pseudomonas aeruginosa]